MAWPTRSVDLEVVLSWVPTAEGFLLNVLYNAPGDHDDYRYSVDNPVPIDLERLGVLGDADLDDYGVALGEMLFPAGARALLDKAVVASNEDAGSPEARHRPEGACRLPGHPMGDLMPAGVAAPPHHGAANPLQPLSCPRQRAFNRHLSRGPATCVRSSP